MLRVQPLTTLGEFQECERIQEEVWGAPGVTAEFISVAAKYGGAVLGAFAGGKMAGFLFAFLARRRAVDLNAHDAVRGFRDSVSASR
jgi:predicted GNAT superfamily acetyltransferase